MSNQRILHSQSLGIHPAAFVGPTPPDTTGLQDHVLWIETPVETAPPSGDGDDMPRSIVTASANTTLTAANVLVVCTAPNLHIVLPDAAANAGQAVTVVDESSSFTVYNPDASTAQNATQRPWNGISDGRQWWNTDF